MDHQGRTLESIAELRAEVDEARHLASTLDKYAASLETDADFWELWLRRSEAA